VRDAEDMASRRTNSGSSAIAVVVEIGDRRVFASALDWPGWCRSAPDEAGALDALVTYAARYSAAARAAGVRFAARGSVVAESFEVVERLKGSATTDFGAPGAIAEADHRPMTSKEAERQAALVKGAWAVLDSVVREAPAALRKGPRGGGRDRDAMVDHVLGAEVIYARKLGDRGRQPAADDRAAVDAHRRAILEVVAAPSDGAGIGAKGWPVRYGARRIAWHVLDHAWEIEDKSA
jgi:hypothetical protein